MLPDFPYIKQPSQISTVAFPTGQKSGSTVHSVLVYKTHTYACMHTYSIEKCSYFHWKAYILTYNVIHIYISCHTYLYFSQNICKISAPFIYHVIHIYISCHTHLYIMSYTFILLAKYLLLPPMNFTHTHTHTHIHAYTHGYQRMYIYICVYIYIYIDITRSYSLRTNRSCCVCMLQSKGTVLS
jgi:hypothetical protein